MRVQVQPIHLGSDACIVWLCIRIVGRHKDIEQCDDPCDTEAQAVAFAVNRWKVKPKDVEVLLPEFVPDVEPDKKEGMP